MNNSHDIPRTPNEKNQVIIKSIMDGNLTEYDKQMFTMYENLRTKNMLEGNYVDCSLRVPYLLISERNNSDRTNQRLEEVNGLMSEIKNKNYTDKQKQEMNKKMIELINTIEEDNNDI